MNSPLRISVLVTAATLAASAHGAGDDAIPGYNVIALNTTTQSVIDAGMSLLASYDAVAAGEIGAAVSNGSLCINEMSGGGSAGYVGAADGNTLAVRLNDGVNDVIVAARLRHEWFHWKYGVADELYNGGVLTDCQHFQAWADTYDQLAYFSCDYPGSLSCMRARNAAEKMGEFYMNCVSGGGSATWPPNPPAVCCDW